MAIGEETRVPAGVPCPHILKEEEKPARLASTPRIKVSHLVIEHSNWGRSPEEMCRQQPFLTLSEAYASMVYSFDHQAEIAADDKAARGAMAEAASSPLLQRLRGMRARRMAISLHRYLFLAAISINCWTVAVSPAWACYAIVVGRAASSDGSVLVAHAEQNRGTRLLNFRRIPPQKHEAKSQFELRRGGRLPEVAESSGLLWSELPGTEFSDAFLNEWGVAVVSDSCPSREDDYAVLVRRGEIRDGGIGGMLRRLIAQRAHSAREGVTLAGELIERFGYVDSGRTYVIADPREAWLLAVVRGRHWVARRVPDDQVVVVSNVYVVDTVDLSDPTNYYRGCDLHEALSLAHHFRPSAEVFIADSRLAWWLHQSLQDAVCRDLPARLPAVRAVWDKLEKRAFDNQARTEERALSEWHRDRDSARAFLTQYCAGLAAEADRKAAQLMQKFPPGNP